MTRPHFRSFDSPSQSRPKGSGVELSQCRCVKALANAERAGGGNGGLDRANVRVLSSVGPCHCEQAAAYSVHVMHNRPATNRQAGTLALTTFHRQSRVQHYVRTHHILHISSHTPGLHLERAEEGIVEQVVERCQRALQHVCVDLVCCQVEGLPVSSLLQGRDSPHSTTHTWHERTAHAITMMASGHAQRACA